jgi:hypothetical protein
MRRLHSHCRRRSRSWRHPMDCSDHCGGACSPTRYQLRSPNCARVLRTVEARYPIVCFRGSSANTEVVHADAEALPYFRTAWKNRSLRALINDKCIPKLIFSNSRRVIQPRRLHPRLESILSAHAYSAYSADRISRQSIVHSKSNSKSPQPRKSLDEVTVSLFL